MPKYSVHIPEQAIIVDIDPPKDEMLASSVAGRSLILWDNASGAFAQLEWEYHRISD